MFSFDRRLDSFELKGKRLINREKPDSYDSPMYLDDLAPRTDVRSPTERKNSFDSFASEIKIQDEYSIWDQSTHIPRWKRLLLLAFLGYIPLIFFDVTRHHWYIIPLAVITTFSLLQNIPCLVIILHTKQVCFDDLSENNAELTDGVKRRFQRTFMNIMYLTLPVLAGGLVGFYFERLSEEQVFTYATVGILGGILSLYTKIHNVIGKVVLQILILKKEREIRSRHASPTLKPIRSPIVDIGSSLLMS